MPNPLGTIRFSGPPAPSFAEMEDILHRADAYGRPCLQMAVLRNIVVEPIATYLRYFALGIDYTANVRFGEYDQVFQEAVGERGGLLNAPTACVLVFVGLEGLSWDLARNFAALPPSQVAGEVHRIGDYIEAVLAGIRRQTAATVLWHSFELPRFPALGIADYQRDDAQTSTVSALNERLRRSLAGAGSAYLVDLNACRARLGDAFYDDRYWHIGRAPYSREALRDIALEDFKYVRAITGKQKKCLVLDCDGVLWGGIVGEDRLEGIKLGRAYPGSPYCELQQEILNLYHRGVILALCSRNNEADVWEVFRNHPDMLLREEHIAAARINWQDKATNLRDIASELNLGLDSLVFADDSEVECSLIRSVLPQVEVLHLPADRAIEHRSRLAASGWFDALVISGEDRDRGVWYKAEAERTKARAESLDLDSYFTSLDMRVQIRPADRTAIPRIAQLTQKTNQFNLTTRRYSEEQVTRLTTSGDVEVLGLRLADRYGDAGLVGVAILRYQHARVVFDTFLLSCRVLGRRVEDAFLVRCLEHARDRGATTAVGEFVPTARNQMARNFYVERGFQAAEPAESCERSELDLKTFSAAPPAIFSHIDAQFGGVPERAEL